MSSIYLTQSPVLRQHVRSTRSWTLRTVSNRFVFVILLEIRSGHISHSSLSLSHAAGRGMELFPQVYPMSSSTPPTQSRPCFGNAMSAALKNYLRGLDLPQRCISTRRHGFRNANRGVTVLGSSFLEESRQSTPCFSQTNLLYRTRSLHPVFCTFRCRTIYTNTNP